MAGHVFGKRLGLGLVVFVVDDDPQPFPRRRGEARSFMAEGRTPEAGGRSLVARMKQQWASFSGLLKDMAVAPRPHFGLEG